MQYRSGTCSVTNGNNTVNFTGNTADASGVTVGDQFKADIDGSAIYQVASRTPASGPTLTSITLSVVYGGTTTAGLSYQIVSDFSLNRGYPLLAQGDMDAADWLSKIVTMIDADVSVILGSAGGTPTLANGKIVYKSSSGLSNSNLYYDDVNSRIGVGTTTLDANALATLKGGVLAIGGYQLSLEEPTQGGYGVGIAFRHIDSTDATKVVAAKIVADGDEAWSAVTSRTSRLSFWTMNNGALSERMRLTGNGALLVGTTITNGTQGGMIGLANNTPMVGALVDGSGFAALIKMGADNKVFLDADGNGVRFGESLIGIGTGPTATLEAIGGTGPTSSQQYAWRRFVGADGSYEYVPVWK